MMTKDDLEKTWRTGGAHCPRHVACWQEGLPTPRKGKQLKPDVPPWVMAFRRLLGIRGEKRLKGPK
jgi:hypothetical protein